MLNGNGMGMSLDRMGTSLNGMGMSLDGMGTSHTI